MPNYQTIQMLYKIYWIQLNTIPSQVCKDPWDEKCTLHNQDAVQETQVSGRVRSIKLQLTEKKVKVSTK